MDPKHPSHILPPPLPAASRVLDIGCGVGQTLIAAYREQQTFGLDIDFDNLRVGRTLTGNTEFVCGSAENLPWANSTFDAVVSRVALPYTNLGTSLREIARVLRPGGLLWSTLHPFSMTWEHAKASSWKGKVHFGYVLANSLLFSATLKQFKWGGRYESFQTAAGMTRALQRFGFADVKVSDDRHFVVTARRL